MSDDNLIFLPNKSKPEIEMSDKEMRWMVAGSLMLVLLVALGLNATLLGTQSTQPIAQAIEAKQSSRSIASINPMFRVSWEKRAFEVIDQSRTVANVGQKPTAIENFTLGSLGGHYSVRENEGFIKEVQFNDSKGEQPYRVTELEGLIKKHLSVFFKEAKSLKRIQSTQNGLMKLEIFQIKSESGQDLGVIQVVRNQSNDLLSVVVQ